MCSRPSRRCCSGGRAGGCHRPVPAGRLGGRRGRLRGPRRARLAPVHRWRRRLPRRRNALRAAGGAGRHPWASLEIPALRPAAGRHRCGCAALGSRRPATSAPCASAPQGDRHRRAPRPPRQPRPRHAPARRRSRRAPLLPGRTARRRPARGAQALAEQARPRRQRGLRSAMQRRRSSRLRRGGGRADRGGARAAETLAATRYRDLRGTPATGTTSRRRPSGSPGRKRGVNGGPEFRPPPVT